MKKTLAKSLRSALALVLALVMVLGTVGTTFAAELPEVGKDDAAALVAKLSEVLREYAPKIVEKSAEYAKTHGYVAEAKEYAAAVKGAVAEFLNEYEIIKDGLNVVLAGPKAAVVTLTAEVKALYAYAQEMKVDMATLQALIALQQSGVLNNVANPEDLTADDIKEIEQSGILEQFGVKLNLENLTTEQILMLKDLGLSTDTKPEDLTDEQIEALKAAGLVTEEVKVENIQKEDLKELENLQNSMVEAEEKAEELQAKIDELQAKIDAVQAKIDAVQAKVDSIIEAAREVEDLSATMESVIKEGTLAAAKVAVDTYIEAREALFARLAEIEKPYTQLDNLVVDMFDLTAELTAANVDLAKFLVNDLAPYAKKAGKVALGAAALAAAKALEVDEIAAVVAKAKEVLPVVAEKVVAKLAELKAAVYKAFKAATTADYEITYGSNYVAIGDDTANADDSYVDLLNAELGLLVDADKTLTEFTMIQDVELDEELVAGADFITLGFSAANFAAASADAFLGYTNVDWTSYELPETALAAVKLVVDEIIKYVEALGLSGEALLNFCAAVEALAYNSLVYAYELPKTVAEIRAINPDAVLVVVGLDNPLENASVKLGDALNIPLDKLTDAIVEVSNVYTLAYAMITGDCTFVAAPNAANDAEGTLMQDEDLAKAVLRDLDTLLPNAEGQKYIQERIYNALNVSYNYLWGDVNLDAVVDYMDAVQMLRYDVGLIGEDEVYMPVFDVTADAEYDYQDAVAVLRYDVGLITKFPVEK